MATLVSPGVSVSVTDESFYAAAGAGTVPLIVIATGQDKSGPGWLCAELWRGGVSTPPTFSGCCRVTWT